MTSHLGGAYKSPVQRVPYSFATLGGLLAMVSFIYAGNIKPEAIFIKKNARKSLIFGSFFDFDPSKQPKTGQIWPFQ